MAKPEFENSSYFILPLKIDSPEKLKAYLRSSKWKEERKEEEHSRAFDPQYLMFYAGKMTDSADDRFRQYSYTNPEMQDNFFLNYKTGSSGSAPTMKNISLYVFGEEIAFLEFMVSYNEMSEAEIVKFVNDFRSLRESKKNKKDSDQQGCKGLEETAADILPAAESGTTLCFSNPSEIKRQANIFTMLHKDKPKDEENKDKLGNEDTKDEDKKDKDSKDEEVRKLCSRLTHGYRTVSTSEENADSAYDKCLHLNAREYWGICPDGLAYINHFHSKPFADFFGTLCTDFHFMYLLLLNQRFSAISFIEEISRFKNIDKAEQDISKVYRRMVELRTRYSFRVISDDFFVQTVYSTAYKVLEIDSLLHDLEDANGQFNELSRTREKKVEKVIYALTLLTIFSALADLASYIGMLPLPPLQTNSHWISFALIVIFIIYVQVNVFGRKK